MVCTAVPYRKGHVVDDSLCADEGTEDKVGAVFGLSENVRNTVFVNCFFMVVVVMVFVGIGVGRGNQGGDHKGVHLRLGFLQVVSTIVIPALQSSGLARIEGGSHVYGPLDEGAAAILGMASLVKPGFAVPAAVDSVELERSVPNHGINAFADNERARNIFPDFDAQASVRRDSLGNVSYHQVARGACCCDGITPLVASCGICPCVDMPFRRCFLPRSDQGSRDGRRE